MSLGNKIKANSHIFSRCFAKLVDLCVIMFLYFLFPSVLGVLAGMLYTLLHDGLFHGQSLGKKIFKIKVHSLKDNAPCSFESSAIRNAPLAVPAFFWMIPFWGWILLVLIGFPLVILEVYLMLTMDQNTRLGDVMADTVVVGATEKS